MKITALAEHFAKARRDPSLAVLEGYHPLKHALRFNAAIDLIVVLEGTPFDAGRRGFECITVKPDVFRQLAPIPPQSGVIAVAKRRITPAHDLLKSRRSAPLVLLEKPSHMGNVGAIVRVAAAAGADGVVVIGDTDPWHPAAVRGAAGLQYALPVTRIDELPEGSRHGPLIGIDPEGEPLKPQSLPSDAMLVFGSESRGLSEKLQSLIEHRVAIPMQPGVSSLNLATAVAVTLYTWKLANL